MLFKRYESTEVDLSLKRYFDLLYLMLISSNLIGQLAGWQFWMSHGIYHGDEIRCRDMTFDIIK